MVAMLKAMYVGVGATLLLDFWNFVLSLFGIDSLNYRYVGRWIGHFPKGKFAHKNILTATPVQGEAAIGWAAHYFIGISFALLLVMVYGNEWLETPMLSPALIIGILTVSAPLFIMQPALGFGIASSHLANPNARRLKSVMTHVVYGIGLYVTAGLFSRFWN